MNDFEQAIEEAIAGRVIPGCVLVATNRDGTFTYSKAFGHRSIQSSTETSPLLPSSIMWTASCTKLQTSICCAQLVERGLVHLDEPVYTHIPELKDWPILRGFSEDGSPIEVPHTVPITLRTLLTHTSGLTYDVLHPLTVQWLKHHGSTKTRGGTVLERFIAPMVFEPGASWVYGPGIDFAGLLLERVTGQTLDAYMETNLWEPLGIKDMTFFLSKRSDLKERMTDMSTRGTDGKVGPGDVTPFITDDKGQERTGCMGGDGIFTCATDYLKVLRALLAAQYDEKILKKETVEEFFKPQMSQRSVNALDLVLNDPIVNNAMVGLPKEVKKNWGLGGLIIGGDMSDGKKEGTMFWGGVPNLLWFIDRKTGLCGLYAGQLLPPGDAEVVALTRKFEAGIYDMYASSKHCEGLKL